LLISTDLDEVVSLSDRIGVLYEGRLLPGEALLPAGTPRSQIGALMGGDTSRLKNQNSLAEADVL
jgi:simple sugar transport system ATP-binding protein